MTDARPRVEGARRALPGCARRARRVRTEPGHSGFWARHPRIIDILVAAAATFFSGPWYFLLPDDEGVPVLENIVWGSLIALACLTLLLRRRFPVAVCVAAAIPALALPAGAADVAMLIPAFGLYAVAVYRPRRAAWVLFSFITTGLLIATVVREPPESGNLEGAVWSTALMGVVLMVGVLAGLNTRARHRLFAEIVDRSRRLEVERDQRARLAAAEERARIAREMHDIVAHSLTVIVALSEGLSVASPERARETGRTVAETARGALGEMRAMLGVLRESGDVGSPLTPLEPPDPAAIVAAAQAAGFPVVLHRVGDLSGVSRQVRFALGRVVQEAVTNAMRHAPRATRIRVDVEARADGVSVTVENDGVSTPTSPSLGAGYGLRGLQERVLSVGGTVSSEPYGAERWTLHAELPTTP